MIGRNFSGADTSKHMMRVVTAAWALNIVYGVSILVYKILAKIFMKKKHAKVYDEQNITAFESEFARNGKGKPNVEESTRSGVLTLNDCKQVHAAETTPKSGPDDVSDIIQENENNDTFRKQHCVSPEESLRSN